jgi:hypothetical protein
MAIPPKQIGSSNKANILWEISKQLDRAIAVTCTGPCPTTTTTTTTAPLIAQSAQFGSTCGPCATCPPTTRSTLYTQQSCIDNITVGCHMYENLEGTINAPKGYYYWVNEDYFYLDSNGIVANINTCPQPFLVFTNNTFVNCSAGCTGDCPLPFSYFEVYMLQSCIDSWPQVGCEVWLDINGSILFPSGIYPKGNEFGCIEIDNGVVISVP